MKYVADIPQRTKGSGIHWQNIVKKLKATDWAVFSLGEMRKLTGSKTKHPQSMAVAFRIWMKSIKLDTVEFEVRKEDFYFRLKS